MIPFPFAPRFDSSSVNPFANEKSSELTTLSIRGNFSWQSISSETSSIAPTQSTHFYSCKSSDAPSPYHGIFEDHPGLNPYDERVVEFQCAIREKWREFMIDRSGDAVQIAAEGLHAESNNIDFSHSTFSMI